MRRAIAAQHDLFLRVVQRIEGVKKLGLGPFFSSQKLNVVDQQHVDGSIPLSEVDHTVVAYGVDHLVHEPLGRDVGELQVPIVLQDVLADSVHQVRFSQTHAAVDEQRVVGTRRSFGHGATRCVRELIRRADDERVEGVAGIQARGARLRRRRRDAPLQRCSLIGAQRDGRHVRRSVASRIGHEVHEQIGPLQLSHRLADHAGVVLGQPLLEQRIGHPDRHRRPIVSHVGRRSEPCVETVPVHLGFDAREDLVPDVHIASEVNTDI